MAQITENIVLGLHGPRFISADLNGSEADFPILQYWESLGWIEAQNLHFLRTGEAPLPTCKGKTRPDYLFLSPELASWFVDFEHRDVFADHSTLIAYLKIPHSSVPSLRWPMTTKVPWHSVDLEAWHDSPSASPPSFWESADTTCFLRAFGQSYEESFAGYCNGLPGSCLPTGAKGRGSALQPKPFHDNPPSVRPSRHGEECPAVSALSRPLCHWFKQLRRMQSLLHNLRLGRTTPEAVDYRLSTWASIRSAPGFAPTFPAWWSCRLHRVQGAPLLWPGGLPSLELMECIFVDFRSNYRAYESWHVQNNRAVAKESMKESLGKAFKAVVGKPKTALDHLEKRSVATVVAINPRTHVATLDTDVPDTVNCVYHLDGVPALIDKVSPCHFHIRSDLLLCPGQELQVSEWLTEPAAILEEVHLFWSKRWNKHAGVPPSHWERVIQFVDAHLAPLPFEEKTLTVAQWDLANSRYQAHAARGPDSFDHLDLRRMPVDFKAANMTCLMASRPELPGPISCLLELVTVCQNMCWRNK